MGSRYTFSQLDCPLCGKTNSDVDYAPTSNLLTHRCEHCNEEFDIEATFNGEEFLGYADEVARNSKAIEDLVDSYREPFASQPLVSQLAIAIEETLIVYHEPYFIRWACRCLQGIVDRDFMPIDYMEDRAIYTWAGRAAIDCAYAAKQPVPDNLVHIAATAIECAMRAQDVMTRKNREDIENE